MSTREYNLRIAPVLSYVGQLVAPPPEVTAAGRIAANRLLHFPHNCLPTVVWRRLDGLGMVQPRLVDVAAWPALAAARARLAPVWRYGVQILQLAADEGATLAQLQRRCIEPRGWAAPASAHTLEAPFVAAPPEVDPCAPTLAHHGAGAAAQVPAAGLYAEIQTATGALAAAAELAGAAGW